MLCEDCGRNRAVVHITQIGPDGKIEKNLCERCAAKYGEFLMENQKHRNVSMNDFLKGVFSAGAQGEKPQQEKVTELVCPNCGMSYRDFQQTGKIGCSVCYATFRRQLEPLLRRIHGSSTHSGKIPHRTGGTLRLAASSRAQFSLRDTDGFLYLMFLFFHDQTPFCCPRRQ